MTSWVLGIDTSTVVCAGLARDGVAVATRTVGNSHSHVEMLIPCVQEMLSATGASLPDVERICIGVGPGPFTGLRVGIATAVTLGQVLDVPLHGVCTLDVIAAQWMATGGAPQEFVIASDARRKELYWARYSDGRRAGEPQVTDPARLPHEPVAGPGVDVYPELLGERRPADAPCSVDAGFMAANWQSIPDAGLAPLYLRKPDAELPSARKSALNGRHRRMRPARRAVEQAGRPTTIRQATK